MAHKIAKLLLDHAGTAIERQSAIQSAIDLGMPLSEVEAYLDWLDAVRGPLSDTDGGGNRDAPKPSTRPPRVDE